MKKIICTSIFILFFFCAKSQLSLEITKGKINLSFSNTLKVGGTYSFLSVNEITKIVELNIGGSKQTFYYNTLSNFTVDGSPITPIDYNNVFTNLFANASIFSGGGGDSSNATLNTLFKAGQSIGGITNPLPTGSNTIGSIGNTGFNINGTLPAFATTPTFNLGSLNGAATSFLQTTGNSSLSSIDAKTATLVSGRVPVDGSGVTQPISAASLPLPTNAATDRSTAASPFSNRLSDGTAFYDARQIRALTASDTISLAETSPTFHSSAPTTQPAQAQLVSATYQATPITLATGQSAPIQSDANGRIITSVQRSSSLSVNATITTGGTAQVAVTSNANRNSLLIQNTSSTDLFISIGGTASATSFKISSGSSFIMSRTDVVNTNAVSIFGATTGQTYSYLEQ